MRKRKLSLVLAAALLPLFSACGDDNSGSAPRTSDNHGALGEFASVEDLPECSSEYSGELAKVKGDYYTCFDKAWEQVDGFADGVCNIRACGSDTEGDLVYVEKGKEAYQCKSGAWKNSSNKSFSDSAFIECYVEAILTAKTTSKDSLKNCTEKREGDLAYVADDLYACASKKWVKQQGLAVSESDLGVCNDEKNVYVLSRMASYTCKDGNWYRVGAESSPEQSSSSNKKEDPTASSSSSSEAAVVIPTDDSTKVRGVCIASRSDIEEGDSVSYVFYNMGGTPVTFSWLFGEKASLLGSDEVSPTVTYLGGGNHRAQLVINKGLPSESDVIICTGVKIPGIPITNCKCNADIRSIRVSTAFPDTAAWFASDCEGGKDFVYDWYLPNRMKSSTPDSNTFMALIDSKGKYSPILTVTNDDDEMMDVACPVVNAIERQDVSATCEIYLGNRYYYSNSNNAGADDFIIDMRDIRNANFVTQLPIALTSDYGYSADYTAKCASSGEQYYDGEYIPACYYWGFNENSYIIPKPDVPGRHTYTLSTDGDEICTVKSPVTCGPASGSITRFDSTQWRIRGVGNYTEGTYQWTFVDSDSNITQSTEMEPKFAYPEMGRVSATLTIDEGKDTEITLTCSSLSITGRPILSCECSSELVSDTNDLGAVDEVVYKWTVSGCKDYGAAPLTYIWDEDYAQDAESPSIATGAFSVAGEYTPIVQVINIDSTVAKVRCDTATVIGIKPIIPIDTTVVDTTVVDTTVIDTTVVDTTGSIIDTTGSVVDTTFVDTTGTIVDTTGTVADSLAGED